LSKQDNVYITSFIYSESSAAISGNNFSHFNLTYWRGADGYDSYGNTVTSNFNGISGPGTVFASNNINQVVKVIPNLGSGIPLFHADPGNDTQITSAENNEKLLYCPSSKINIGLTKVVFNETSGWTWLWSGSGIGFSDGTVGLIIPLQSILPENTYLLSVSISVSFNCPWEVYETSHGTPNTSVQVSLEYNGQVVDTASPYAPINPITLNYYSNTLATGIRPLEKSTKEMVIKMKQGIPDGTTPIFGRWVGPSDTGMVPAMFVGYMHVTYMY
jgi:hypothetical protein